MMKIQTLDELEHSIGGRPELEHKKKRIVFYISPHDHLQLKQLSKEMDIPISEIVRNAIKNILQENKLSR